MKCGSFDPLSDGPFHGFVKDRGFIFVHSEDETRIDHHSQVM